MDINPTVDAPRHRRWVEGQTSMSSRSFLTTMNRVARSLDQAAKASQRERERQVRNQMRAVREAERAQKALERAIAADERERKRLYVEARVAEVEAMNEALEQAVDDLESLLAAALSVRAAIDFEAQKIHATYPSLSLGALGVAAQAPLWSAFEPKKPGSILGWTPGFVRRSHEERVAAARKSFEDAKATHERQEAARLQQVDRAKEAHQIKVQKIREEADAHNAEIDGWRLAFEGGEREAVEGYFSTVLAKSAYPEGFPCDAKVAYISGSRQLVVEYDLPELEAVIPTAKGYTYVKTGDRVNESARPEKQRRALYAGVVARVVLRSLHELFSADLRGMVETIVFNAHVDTINPATGQPVRPCLVTVRTTREAFQALNLAAVDPQAALQALNASVSKSPAELAPVRPLIEFNMVDPRFIKEADVLGTLGQRPNLMDLSPGEFESLITNLFQKMGLETKLTQASRDGGVDCVAFDPRPIFGGKVVIQAKRYKNTVGVSSVRDLFGTMQNEGASKGILVTTSGYGKAAFDFANGKPMELLDGGNLLFLLKEHADLDARILISDEDNWR